MTPENPESNYGMATEYERMLPAALDVLLPGVGPDGHTASLFPGSPALAERTRRVVPVRLARRGACFLDPAAASRLPARRT